MDPPIEPIIHDIFETKTCTWQYVVADPETKAAVIIDPVLDFDPAKALISTETADALLALVQREGYDIRMLLETHAHADHLTAARYLQTKIQEQGGRKPDVGIGKRIDQVQSRFAAQYGIGDAECVGAFDKLFDDDEDFSVGSLRGVAMHLPGHTPDHVGYLIGCKAKAGSLILDVLDTQTDKGTQSSPLANIFCGDSLFNHDVGSARCDFPGGDATALFASVRRLLALPDNYRIWTGHDYPPGADAGRTAPLSQTTVALQKRENKHLKDGVSKDEFVDWRKGRDAGLGEPRLLHQSLQVNIRGGKLPEPTAGAGDRLLHIPLKIQGPTW